MTALTAATALTALLLACGGEHRRSVGERVGWDPGPTPPQWHHGEVLFNTYCRSCHGRHGTGEGLGPALLDTLYRADKLPDESIYTAVALGVRQQHWYYGAMPPVRRMSRDETHEVIGYLRWVQERAGLDDPAPASAMDEK